MSNRSSEWVLCARTSDLPSDWLPEAGATPLTESALFNVLDRVTPHWLQRDQAERDETFKQWIPYVLLRKGDNQLAAYPRQGSEARLHGFWSLGIGGHVNREDGVGPEEPRGSVWRTPLWNGLRRELKEEYPSAVAGSTRFAGLIHERRTAVGRVHIGAVFVHEIANDPGDPGPELAGLRWIPLRDLGSQLWPLNRFELWSQLAFLLLSTSPR